MSRRFDEAQLYLPEELPDEDEAYQYGIYYKRIKDFPDYFVSTEGLIYSFVRPYNPRIMSTYTNQYGHHYVDLTNHTGRHKLLVHRLVAEAFIPNPNNYPIVRHLNDEPHENIPDNLAWGTYADNTRDAVEHGSFYMEPIYCIEDDLDFRSVHEAARYYNVSPASIVHACKGKIKSCLKKHFCYLREKDTIDRSKLTIHTGFKPIIAIDPDGNEHIYESRKEAAAALGIPDCGISSVANGHLKYTHGYRFREV